jgi:Flp pilus assembly protein TadD
MSRTSSARRLRRASRPKGRPAASPPDRQAEAPGAARRARIALLLILAATAAVYLNSLVGEFVYDDRFQILRNPRLASWSELPRFLGESVWQFTSGEGPVAGAYYRPLFNFALLALWQLFAAKTLGWHLVSLALHLTATALLFVLVRRWTAAQERDELPAAALFAALVFGLHPVHSEVVAWISALPDLLAVPLLLGALLLYESKSTAVDFVESTPADVRLLSPRRLAAALYFLAVAAKETAIVFPAFLVARELLAPTGDRVRRGWAVVLAPFAVAAAGSLALRHAVMGFLTREDARNAGVSTAQVLLSAPVLLLRYLRLLLVPWPLTVVYPFDLVRQPFDGRLLLALLVLGAALFALVRFASREVRLGAIWTLLFLLPVLNVRFFNPLESLLHDRYLYLPSIGFALAAGVAWAALARRRRPVALALAAALALAMGVATAAQNRQWRDDLALARRTLAVRPESAFFHNYLGAMRTERGDMAGAEAPLLEALRLRPDYPEAAANLGNLYFQSGRFAEAEPAYVRAIGKIGIPADITLNLSIVRIRLGKMPAAADAARQAIAARPHWPEAHYTLGWIEQNQGRVAEAEASYREALRLRPVYVEPRVNLAELLRAGGRFALAIELLREGLRLVPGQAVFARRLAELEKGA